MFNQVNTNKICTNCQFKVIIRIAKAIEQSESIFLEIIKKWTLLYKCVGEKHKQFNQVLGVKMNLKWMFSSELETK